MNAFLIGVSIAITVIIFRVLFKVIRVVYLLVKVVFNLVIRIINIIASKKKSTLSDTDALEYHPASMPAEIGKVGENDLAERLSVIEKNGILFRNIYLPSKNGATTEVDAILLTDYGIYVFEYKNYNCDIVIPNDSRSNWIRYNHGDRSVGYEVYNPVIQNENHINAFKHCIHEVSGMYGIDSFIHSYVVLGDNCRIYSDVSYIPGATVMNISCLNRLETNATYQIPDMVLLVISNILRKYSNVSADVKEKHIDFISNNKNNNHRSSNFIVI